MKQATHFSITVGNKKYAYSLTKVNKKETYVACRAAKIGQSFLHEDIPALLVDLPHLIIAEKDYQKGRAHVIRFRVNPEDKKIIEQKASKSGYSSVSRFLRDLALNQ